MLKIFHLSRPAGEGKNIIPDDAITFGVVVERYHVSRGTLQGAVKAGTIKSYRAGGKNAKHLVSESAVAKLYSMR